MICSLTRISAIRLRPRPAYQVADKLLHQGILANSVTSIAPPHCLYRQHPPQQRAIAMLATNPACSHTMVPSVASRVSPVKREPENRNAGYDREQELC